MDNTFALETPEQIEFEYEVAGIGSRFMAALVDHLILAIIQFGFYLAVAFIDGLFGGGALFYENLLIALLLFISFLLFWGYFVLFEVAWNGQSPGKRLARLRVIQTTGYPQTGAASAIRNLVRIADFLPFSYGLGIIVMFFNARAMRLGDFAAGTMVVKEREPLSLDQLATRTAPPPTPDLLAPPLPNLARLREEEVSLAREALRRHSEGAPDHLLARLATTLAARLGVEPAAQGIEPARFLAMVVAQRDPAARATIVAPPPVPVNHLAQPAISSAGAREGEELPG